MRQIVSWTHHKDRESHILDYWDNCPYCKEHECVGITKCGQVIARYDLEITRAYGRVICLACRKITKTTEPHLVRPKRLKKQHPLRLMKKKLK